MLELGDVRAFCSIGFVLRARAVVSLTICSLSWGIIFCHRCFPAEAPYTWSLSSFNVFVLVQQCLICTAPLPDGFPLSVNVGSFAASGGANNPVFCLELCHKSRYESCRFVANCQILQVRCCQMLGILPETSTFKYLLSITPHVKA